MGIPQMICALHYNVGFLACEYDPRRISNIVNMHRRSCSQNAYSHQRVVGLLQYIYKTIHIGVTPLPPFRIANGQLSVYNTLSRTTARQKIPKTFTLQYSTGKKSNSACLNSAPTKSQQEALTGLLLSVPACKSRRLRLVMRPQKALPTTKWQVHLVETQKQGEQSFYILQYVTHRVWDTQPVRQRYRVNLFCEALSYLGHATFQSRVAL